MLKFRNFVFSLLLFAVAFYGCKTQKLATNGNAKTNSLLYKITGNDIEPSFLFGTIHVLPKANFELKGKVVNAFNNAEQIVLELDMDNPNMMAEMMQLSMLPDSLSIDKILNEADYNTINTELQKIGMSLQLLNKVKPLIIQQMIMMQFLGDEPASFENTFVAMAKANEQEVLGLETLAYQMGIFETVSYEDQLADIIEMINEGEKSGDMFTNMLDVYLSEDIEALYQMFGGLYEMEDELIDVMLHNRNKEWISKITELAKQKETFFGVGAGHLGGKQGVVNLLKEAGYTVTPVVD